MDLILGIFLTMCSIPLFIMGHSWLGVIDLTMGVMGIVSFCSDK
jgi:hypothetical protein